VYLRDSLLGSLDLLLLLSLPLLPPLDLDLLPSLLLRSPDRLLREPDLERDLDTGDLSPGERDRLLPPGLDILDSYVIDYIFKDLFTLLPGYYSRNFFYLELLRISNLNSSNLFSILAGKIDACT